MRAFVAASHGFGNLDKSTNQIGLDYTAGTVTFGVDFFDYSKGWTLGAAASVNQTDGDVDSSRGHINVNAYGLSVYGLNRFNSGFVVDGAVSLQGIDLDYKRFFTVPGVGFAAEGDLEGTSVDSHINVNYPLATKKRPMGAFIRCALPGYRP